MDFKMISVCAMFVVTLTVAFFLGPELFGNRHPEVEDRFTKIEDRFTKIEKDISRNNGDITKIEEALIDCAKCHAEKIAENQANILVAFSHLKTLAQNDKEINEWFLKWQQRQVND